MTPSGYRVSVTASVGVAVVGEGLHTATALLAAADSGLYATKAAGRNRVMSPTGTASARSGAGLVR